MSTTLADVQGQLRAFLPLPTVAPLDELHQWALIVRSQGVAFERHTLLEKNL
jgi:hypothetical protein